jgi:hypothetical protein
MQGLYQRNLAANVEDSSDVNARGHGQPTAAPTFQLAGRGSAP